MTEPKAETANLAIWNALAKTDPRHVKAFKRAGGFSGTAIKPIWIVQMLTAQFGPIGKGWGMGEPTYQVVPGNNGEVLVYCTVRCWHTQEENTFYGVGGDKVVTYIKANDQYNRPERWENDDEAFKKAFTDAIGNAFKFLGVGADVHMGLFDDSKYVEEVAGEYAAREADNELRREPAARAKLDGPHTSKTALRTAVHDIIAKVREIDDVAALNALLKAEKPTLDQATRDWPALILGDPDIEEDVGLKGSVEARRAALADDTPVARLIAEMRSQQTPTGLSRWLGALSDEIELIVDADGRRFQAAVDAHEAALAEVGKLTAG